MDVVINEFELRVLTYLHENATAYGEGAESTIRAETVVESLGYSPESLECAATFWQALAWSDSVRSSWRSEM